MGYCKHNVIVVTNWNLKIVSAVHLKAKEIFAEVFGQGKIIPIDGSILISPVMQSVVNAQYTFFVAPDGSNEGWHESDLGDEARKKFLDWLGAQEDNYCDYIEIRFG